MRSLITLVFELKCHNNVWGRKEYNNYFWGGFMTNIALITEDVR